MEKISTTVTLNNGVEIPRVGLGVFRAGHEGQTHAAVTRALEVGYRHVDTAHIYRNEAEVGAAVREWCARTGTAREEVFVTSKLWNHDQGYDTTLKAFDATMEKLGLEVLDLYLIHWPVPERRVASWKAMERLLEEGRCRAIGVSNFTIRHMEALLAEASVVPAVNQFELHPFLQQPETVAFCHAHGIVVEAYSPLTKARRLDEPVLVSVAEEVGRSPAQVLIRWSLQKGFVTLPKSSNPGRIKENAGAVEFALSAAQMEALDGLEEGLRTAWDPTEIP